MQSEQVLPLSRCPHRGADRRLQQVRRWRALALVVSLLHPLWEELPQYPLLLPGRPARLADWQADLFPRLEFPPAFCLALLRFSRSARSGSRLRGGSVISSVLVTGGAGSSANAIVALNIIAYISTHIVAIANKLF